MSDDVIARLAMDELGAENKRLKAERDRLYTALQSIAGYRSHRVGTEAWGLAAHYCQTTAREALGCVRGGEAAPEPTVAVSAADPDFAKCGHPADQVKPGPRIPLVYGTAATEVCGVCGGYRQTRCPGGWEPGPPDTLRGEDL